MNRHDNDEFERRLLADANDIRADVSPQLRARINASIRSAAEQRTVPVAPGTRESFWWASSLTGIAAALLVIVLINWNREPVPEPASVTTVTPEISERPGSIPLKVKTADLTGPLEEELQHLQSDLEKARETVEGDLRLTF